MIPVCRRTVGSLLLVALTAGAQIAARYTVTGTVVNSVTNAPVRHALVALGGSMVFSREDGRFEVANMPEGPTMIAAQKPGFFDNTLDRKTIFVQSGKNDVLLKLVPESRIQGQVVDGDGEPLAGINVQALAERVIDGRMELRGEGGGNTDAHGHYLIEGLAAGKFLIRTFSMPDDWASPEKPGGAEEVFPQQYYPNAPDISAAQPTELTPGESAQADFKLRPLPAFHITGTIAPAVPSVAITAEDAGGQRFGLWTRFDAKTGNFAIRYVPAGTWTLIFERADEQHHLYYARETVAVSSNNVDGLRVLLQPLASIQVNRTNAAGESVELGNVELEAAGDYSYIRHWAMAPAGKPYGFTAIRPGNYRVLVSGLGGQCIDSLTSGDVDLTRELLAVAAGSPPPPINLRVGGNCSALEVSARLRTKGETAQILVLPSNPNQTPLIPGVDQAGKVKLSDLAPGEYSIYAFTNLNGLEYRNPEVMRGFQGEHIILSANQNAALTVDVNDWSNQ
jgi:hypothetical protein